jgi:hypothetical protein
VIDENGNNLDNLLVGFNPSSFWSLGRLCCIDGEQVYHKGFRIVDIKQKHEFKTRMLTKLIDRKLTKTFKPDKYTVIQTEPTPNK